MGHTRGHLWTADEDRQILDYLAMGYSARQIAAVMEGTTRNAVIGRILRAKALRAHGFAYRAGEALRNRIESKAKIETAAADPLPQHGKVLLHLGYSECKWPLAYDPDITGKWWFCACPVRPGEIYCDKHINIKRRGPNYV